MVRKASIWHARLDIPADVRASFGGMRLFSRSTKLSDADPTFAKAKPWLDQWKAEIESARSGTQAPLARHIAKRFQTEPEGVARDHMLLDTVAGFVAHTQFGLSELDWQNALAAHDLDPRAALESLRGRDAVQSVGALTCVRTPFASRIEDFRKANEGVLATKSLYGYLLDIEKFAKASGDLSIESFDHTHVQAFINARWPKPTLRR
jgi:hypothetical protein